jgi:hypothetical protein
MAICILPKCKIYSEVEGKDKSLLLKWDFLYNHVVHKNTKTNVKKGVWYYSKVCRHAKNKKLFFFQSCEYVVTQIANGVVGEKVQKVVEFANVLHLLQQGCLCWKMRSLF